MTPFELTLRNELEIERQRFSSKWLFPWHTMTMEGKSFDVEDFRGGRISFGGVRFDGQPQTIYWEAIGRYLKGKVHECFQRWDAETRGYPEGSRKSSLLGTNDILRTFVAAVVNHAIDTDQRLRGRGYPKDDTPRGAGEARTGANAEIYRLKEAHLTLLPKEAVAEKRSMVNRLSEAINLRPGMFGISIDLKALFRGRKKS